VKKALVTTSCTHALEMCGLLLNIAPGDEVIVPSFTFVSTANAFALRGARIVFCDIRSDTLNLDETRLEALITKRTKAIVVVHYAGVGCEMDTILEVAGRHNVAVVEDNAHGLFGKFRGRWLGTFGCLGTQSFHETKNITCGKIKHWRSLQQSYGRAPYFKLYAPLLEEFYTRPDVMLADFTCDVTIALARELGIAHSQFIRSSTLPAQGRRRIDCSVSSRTSAPVITFPARRRGPTWNWISSRQRESVWSSLSTSTRTIRSFTAVLNRR
jgi:hypothetical protein